MKTISFFVCLFLFATYIRTSCCDTTVSHVVRSKRSLNGQLSKDSFNMVISEKGSHFNEKVTFDKKKNIVRYRVPAHRDLSESETLIDYNLNLTVTRLAGNGLCYVTIRSPEKPSMDQLWKSMNMVSTGKYKIRRGSTLLSAEWMPLKPRNISKFGKSVLEFCRGMRIYELRKIEQDGVNAIRKVNADELSRTKRELPFPLCQDPFSGAYDHLNNCRNENYVTKCKFTGTRTCYYWVTCDDGITGVKRNGRWCATNHEFTLAICCDLDCPP